MADIKIMYENLRKRNAFVQQQNNELNERLEETTRHAASLAQELNDIISDAEAAGCENPLPGTKALINEWETFFSQQLNKPRI